MKIDQTIKILIVCLLTAAGAALSSCAEPDNNSEEDELISPDFGLVEVSISEPICKFWVQTWTNDILSNASWSGDCANGLAQGDGTLTVQLDAKNPGNISYTGLLKNGYMDGYGSLKSVIFSDAGDRYTHVYNGLFVAGEKTGIGREHRISLDNDGSIYEQTWSGDFLNGSLSGRGRYLVERKNVDGSKKTELKEGNFSNHFLHGPGVETITTLSDSGETLSVSYRGQWVKGTKSGLGVLVESNTEKTTISPSQYSGTWGHGSRHGPGIEYFGPEDHFKGNWEQGDPILGYCALKSENYSGPCRRYEYDTSDYSGMRCLAAKKGQKHCFKAWRSEWIS